MQCAVQRNISWGLDFKTMSSNSQLPINAQTFTWLQNGVQRCRWLALRGTR
jgi:hypothetical protein